MFGWLSKKKPKPPEKLYFKDSTAAFEFAAEYMSKSLERASPLLQMENEQYVMGLIVGDAKPDPTIFRRTVEKYCVRLAVTGGVIEVENCGSIAAGGTLREGDLVAVQVASYDPTYPPAHFMNYFIAVCRLHPTLKLANHFFEIDEKTISQRDAGSPPQRSG